MAMRLRHKGTTFSVDKVGTGTVYTKLVQVLSIGHPSKTVDTIEDTDLDSEAKEFSPGLTDNGEASVQFRFDPSDTNHQYVEDLADEPEVKSYQIFVPIPGATGILYTFNAFPTGFDKPEGGNSDPITATLTLKVSGVVVRSVAPTPTPPG